MAELVFLLEEQSMKVLLDGLLPRIFPDLQFRCIPHEGKQSLEQSIPRKLRAWKTPGVRFVVIRDNDGGDCTVLKERLRSLCSEGRREDSLVRIACQELEAWYLGEPDALAEAFEQENLRGIGGRARFRDPDAVTRPSDALASLAPAFQKVSGARLMAVHLSRERNCSRSFHATLDGIERVHAQMQNEED